MALGCRVPKQSEGTSKAPWVSKSRRTRSLKCLTYLEHSNKHSNRGDHEFCS